MNILVLGCGKIGGACVREFSRLNIVDSVSVVDQSREALNELPADIGAKTYERDIAASESVAPLIREADCVVGATTPAHYLSLTEAAVNAGAHWLDFGGDEEVLHDQRNLNEDARKAGVSVVPACGVAPGLVNMFATRCTDRLDTVEEIAIRVGGLPLEPEPPLDYSLEFSIKGLVAEYTLPVEIIEDGTQTNVSALEGYETLSIDQVGKVEAFFTAGALASLPQRFESEVDKLTYKTIRYPGHRHKIKILSELGFLDADPIEVDSAVVTPRSVTKNRLVSVLPSGQRDLVIGRVTVDGKVDGEQTRLVYELYDEFDDETGMSAMARTTALPGVKIGQLALSNRLRSGVTPAEGDVPLDPILDFLNDRGINVAQRVK